MWASLVYGQLELKRACKRLPHMVAGAVVLIGLLGTIAFLSSRMLYGDAIAGRMEIAVVLPENDQLARQAMTMISSLDSVNSLCDFTYQDQETGLEQMKRKEVYAVMEIPEGFVGDIMNGTNTPVNILLPENAWLESRIFQQLTDAGARTLASSQAGIYAGDELCSLYGLESSIGQLERDLNQIYLGYSLPRSDYFRHRTADAIGDVGVAAFYGCSGVILLLLLCGIPVCDYLLPQSRAMRQKLSLLGVNNLIRTICKTLGMGFLLTIVALPLLLAGVWAGWIPLSLPAVGMMLFMCISMAALLVFLFQLAGTLMGGVMALFIAGTGQHFLAGGFWPEVFLPESIRRIGAWMPSALWLEGGKGILTGTFPPALWLWLGILTLVCLCLSAGMEGRS